MRMSIDPAPGLLEIVFDRVDAAARVFGYSVKDIENLMLRLWCF